MDDSNSPDFVISDIHRFFVNVHFLDDEVMPLPSYVEDPTSPDFVNNDIHRYPVNVNFSDDEDSQRTICFPQVVWMIQTLQIL